MIKRKLAGVYGPNLKCTKPADCRRRSAKNPMMYSIDWTDVSEIVDDHSDLDELLRERPQF